MNSFAMPQGMELRPLVIALRAHFAAVFGAGVEGGNSPGEGVGTQEFEPGSAVADALVEQPDSGSSALTLLEPKARSGRSLEPVMAPLTGLVAAKELAPGFLVEDRASLEAEAKANAEAAGLEAKGASASPGSNVEMPPVGSGNMALDGQGGKSFSRLEDVEGEPDPLEMGAAARPAAGEGVAGFAAGPAAGGESESAAIADEVRAEQRLMSWPRWAGLEPGSLLAGPGSGWVAPEGSSRSGAAEVSDRDEVSGLGAGSAALRPGQDFGGYSVVVREDENASGGLHTLAQMGILPGRC